jgi:hypothetical protein
MEEFGGWYFDLARRVGRSFAHLGPPQERNDSYGDWDATGAYLLALALPRRELLLTGRQPTDVPQIDAATAAGLIADGRGWDNRVRIGSYLQMNRSELLQRLKSWSPVVRERAAKALARAKGEVVPQLIEMLGSRRLETRYGACQGLIEIRDAGAPAIPALLECLGHEDLWLRVKAGEALARVGRNDRRALPILLKRLAREPAADDPRGMEQRYLCFTCSSAARACCAKSISKAWIARCCTRRSAPACTTRTVARVAPSPTSTSSCPSTGSSRCCRRSTRPS